MVSNERQSLASTSMVDAKDILKQAEAKSYSL